MLPVGEAMVSLQANMLLPCTQASNDTRDWIEHDFRTLPFAYRERCTIENVTLRESPLPAPPPLYSKPTNCQAFDPKPAHQPF